MNVKLHGGLGNQLFQYAFGRGIQAQGYDNTDCVYFRNYQLNAWDIKVPLVLDPHASANGAPWWGNTERTYHEPADAVGRFDPKVYDKPADTLFRGYWQTEQYFESHATALRGELCRPTGAMPEDIKRLAEDIQEAPHSAFICVRRGDYMTPALIKEFGCMDKWYYINARRHIEETIGWDTKFFVFSDDPDYCRQEFGASTIIDHRQPNKDIRIWPTAPWDLYLMSLCQHGVTSNTSFGWWGAWLGDNQKNRIVIAPNPWFQKIESSGVVPSRWMKQTATTL
jgi:hypothetical protein